MARKIRIGSDGTIIQEDLSVPNNGQMSAPAATTTDGLNVMRRSRYSNTPATATPAIEPHTRSRHFLDDSDHDVTMGDLWQNRILAAFAHYLGSILGSIALLCVVQNMVVLPVVYWVASIVGGDWWTEALVTLSPMVSFVVALVQAIRFYWKSPSPVDEPPPRSLYWGAFKATTLGALLGLAICVLLFVALPLLGVLAAVALVVLIFL